MRQSLSRLLKWALRKLEPRYTAIHFTFFDGTTTHKVKHMQSTISEGFKVQLAVALLSAGGNAVPASVAPTWVSSDETILTVVPAADGLSAEVFSTGKAGTATITASVDGLTATDEITVVAGAAASITLTASEPEPITPVTV